MKKIILVFLFTVSLISFAQTTYIPDNNFEQTLIDLGYDTVLDDYVNTASISNITSLDVSSKGVNNLIGIEDFTALEELYCYNNHISTLNLTQNSALAKLFCDYNFITDLDVSQNNNLIELWCSYNQLSTLNLSQNLVLTQLHCFRNQIYTLDITQNIDLEIININDNSLTNLITNQNSVLKQVWFNNNNITSLDLTQNPLIESVKCIGNELTEIDIRNGNNIIVLDFNSINNPDLSCIYVDDNQLGNLQNWNIDQTTNLVNNEAMCFQLTNTYVPDDDFEQVLIDLNYDVVLDNYVLTENIKNITTLDVTGKSIHSLIGIEGFESLTSLHCGEYIIGGTVFRNYLTSLDLSHNANLLYLIADYNFELDNIIFNSNINLITLGIGNTNIASLDLSNFTNLEFLNCRISNFTQLDLTNNPNLIHLNCSSNDLTSLDLSNNINLEYLNCQANNIPSLDLSNNINLEYLKCSYNNFTTLDLSNNINLEYLYCSGSELTSLNLTNNFSLLFFYSNFNSELTSLDLRNENNFNITNNSFNIRYNDALTCVSVDDSDWSTENWYNHDNGLIFTVDCATLNVNNEVLNKQIDIFPNPTNNIFKVNITAPYTQIKVYTVLGRLVKTFTKSASYATNGLSKGVYLLKIETEKGILSKKLIIN